jgi:uncharacterized membrane protein (UPF0127 family)
MGGRCYHFDGVGPGIGRSTPGGALRALLHVLLLLLAACGAPEPRAASAGEREVAFVSLGGETFTLELALDPATRQRGLSGRGVIPRHEGMLFVLPTPRPFAMVMRDCPAPIDVAFLDAQGRVVSVHEMAVEPPRAPDEGPRAYEARLPIYASSRPVQFAIETAGGRLRELGLAPGARIPIDLASLVARAR